MFRPLALAALAAAAAAPVAAQPVADSQPVNVTLTNNGIFPARLPLRAGKAYSLRFANESDRRHNFAQRAFFRDAEVLVADRPKLDEGKLSLAPGERAVIRVIAPRRPGARYEFSSTELRVSG